MHQLRDVIIDEAYYFGIPAHLHHCYFVTDFPWATKIPLAIGREIIDRQSDSGLFQSMDYYSLRVIRTGRGTHVVNGHPYSLARGDIYITPLNALHSYRDCHRVEMDAIYFQSRLFTRVELSALQEMSAFWKLFVIEKSRRKKAFLDQRLHLTPEQYREVETVIEDIRRDICEPAAVGPLAARHRFFCLLTTMARWHGMHDTGRDNARTSEFHAADISEVIEFCEDNFREPLSVRQLAAKMWLSPDHFARLFAAETGAPPATYIRRLRLERAQTLLRTSALSIHQIALECGFGDADVMTRAFNAAFGGTPSRYRRSFRAKVG